MRKTFLQYLWLIQFYSISLPNLSVFVLNNVFLTDKNSKMLLCKSHIDIWFWVYGETESVVSDDLLYQNSFHISHTYMVLYLNEFVDDV
jgi:hypothetical protein